MKQCTTLIPSTFLEPLGLFSMLKRACLSSLSFSIGILIFIPPSCSTSPALLDPPPFTSFWVTTPQDSAMAMPHSIKPPVPLVVVLIVLDVAVLIVGCALCRPSCTEMEVNVLFLDILHTIPLHKICVWQRLALMSLWRVLERWDCKFEPGLWPLAGVGGGNWHWRVWCSPGLSSEMSLYGTASFEGLHRCGRGGYMQSRAFGATRCAKKT